MDVSKACGCDGISNKILKICANGITKSFTGLVNLSLLYGSFPNQWKLANVIPIFKKDDRQSKLNYRPVSLLVSLSKIAEKIVFIRLYRVYKKKGNRTLQCFSAFIIQSTDIILSQVERPGF